MRATDVFKVPVASSRSQGIVAVLRDNGCKQPCPPPLRLGGSRRPSTSSHVDPLRRSLLQCGPKGLGGVAHGFVVDARIEPKGLHHEVALLGATGGSHNLASEALLGYLPSQPTNCPGSSRDKQGLASEGTENVDYSAISCSTGHAENADSLGDVGFVEEAVQAPNRAPSDLASGDDLLRYEGQRACTSSTKMRISAR
jgi:hypothetical protein